MFAQSPDQQLFEQFTDRFLDDHYPIGRARELAQAQSVFEPDVWRQAAALGWTTPLVPEEAGGGSVSGNGLADLLIVAAAFGRRAAPGPLFGANIVAAALGRWGSAAQRGGPLAELLAGEAVAAWAHATTGGPLRQGRCRVAEVRSGAEVMLNGPAGCAEGAADASYLLVTAGEAGRTHYLVPRETLGVQLTPLGSIDLTRRFHDITLRNVVLGQAAQVGAPGSAAEHDAYLLDVLAVLLLGEIAGATRRAFEMTAQWLVSRYSFGRPLGSYQEIKHRMADMCTDVEAIEAVAARAASAIGTGRADGQSWACAGMAYAGRRAPEVIQDCIQLHGGIGVTYEHDLHLLLRRVAVDTRLFGTPSEFTRRLGSQAAATPAASTPQLTPAPQPGSQVRFGAGKSEPKSALGTVGPGLSVEQFAERAGGWLAEHMPPADPAAGHFFFTDVSTRTDSHDLARIQRCRQLQRLLYDGGFAGICVPREYGGQGLTAAHQFAFNRELRGYDYPLEIQASTFIPALALLLEFGSEEQKLRHIPAMLRGEEIWAQFLSEPDGGSDAAAAATTAVRDGDRWVLNGSKIWTTGAWYSDWAMCLARTDWEAEKHRGLTIFTLPVRSPGIEINRIEMSNGAREFCQEFLTDVSVEDRDRLGEAGGGWAIMGRWLHHERTISGGSPYVTSAGGRGDDAAGGIMRLVQLAREQGTLDDPGTLELIGEARALSLVGDALVRSVSAKMRSGDLPQHAASMLRLFGGLSTARRATIGFELAGAAAVVWPSGCKPGDPTGDPTAGERVGVSGAHIAAGYLVRQAACIGGGTTEMARNVISERLLGMPREARADDGPFRAVRRSGPRAIGS